MDKPREERRTNPFVLGLVGLLVMLAGYAASTSLAQQFADSPEQQISSRLQEAQQHGHIQGDGEVLDKVQRYYRPSQALVIGGRIVFYIGLLMVIGAGVLWYQQAQLPEEPEDPEPEMNGTVREPSAVNESRTLDPHEN
jgi:hypothetical protein